MRRSRILVIGLLGLLALLFPSDQSDSAAAEDTFWHSPLRIGIVFPQDGRGNPTTVDKSRAVNISVCPTYEVSCGTAPEGAPIWVAKDNGPAHPAVVNGQFVQRTVNGITFPTLELNDVPADLIAEPKAKYRFFVAYLWSNIWVDAVDPRTYAPQPVIPIGYSEPLPFRLDARIQIVWPHDKEGKSAPVEQAQYLNIAVDLFEQGTLNSVPPDYKPDPAGMKLLAARRNDIPAMLNIIEQKTTYVANGQTFPRWVFNDVPVEPGEQYNFMVMATPKYGKIPDFTTSIWTHGTDARTILPDPVPPPACKQ